MIKQKIIIILKSLRIFPFVQAAFIYFFSKRSRLAARYIRGQGLEIGALDTPLKVIPSKASVMYSDRIGKSGLRKHYPELGSREFVDIGLIDNGETLTKIKSASQDFVIANHFIEHCEDPIATLFNHLRVLKKGGIIYWAVPNKHLTFDEKRAITSNRHLWLDHTRGVKFSRARHYKEFVKYALGYSGIMVREKTKELMTNKYSIHYHVWAPDSFYNFLYFAKEKLNMKFCIMDLIINLNEFIVILKKN